MKRGKKENDCVGVDLVDYVDIVDIVDGNVVG